ncbi:MAG: response regulator [Nitrospira sp.]
MDSDENRTPILLMVEDEEDTADLIKLIMKEEGFLVVHAADGRQALEQIDNMPPPDIILLDIQIPHVSGLSVLSMIRSKPEWNAVPVVMLTADSAHADVRKAMELRVQDYILKPFKREVLVSRLHRLCKQSSETSSQKLDQRTGTFG